MLITRYIISKEMASENPQVHIVLVHGACHGAWCWYKVKPLLEAAGHRITALDMAASGIDSRSLHDLRGLADYTKPLLELMAAIPPQEKVVLVGHSLGGLNLALAMDMYPNKISVAVFLAAFMPDSFHRPSHVLELYNERTPVEDWLDTEFLPFGSPEEPQTSMLFGPEFISRQYKRCAREDVALAMMLMRPSSLFLEDLSKKSAFSKEGFGSVKKVYIACIDDEAIPIDFQRWMIEATGVEKVMEIENADHMVMGSRPEKLCECLLEIAKDFG